MREGLGSEGVRDSDARQLRIHTEASIPVRHHHIMRVRRWAKGHARPPFGDCFSAILRQQGLFLIEKNCVWACVSKGDNTPLQIGPATAREVQE